MRSKLQWFLSVFSHWLDPRVLLGTLWHLLLRALGVRGSSLWDHTTAATDRYGDHALQRLRNISDPSADAVVTEILDEAAIGASDPLQARITAGIHLLNDVRSRTELDPAQHVAIGQWMAAFGALPFDIEHARLQRASHFFAENSFLIALIFGTSSLLEAYACPMGIRSLASTDQLILAVERRLAETMQWVLFVESYNSWTSGRAVAAILKIRLMHATIRQLIYLRSRQTNTPWPTAEIGVPICGEDLLGMLMGFAALPIRDLPKLGVGVRSADAEDHLYLWRIVGRFLGVNEELMPVSLAEAKGLVERVKTRLQGEGPKGWEFASALIGFHTAVSPGLARYGRRLMHDLVGDQVSAWLRIKPEGFANARVPHPVPLIRDLTFGAVRAVLRDPISDRIGVPRPGSGGDRFDWDVPATAAVRSAHAALERRGTAELWGKAMLGRERIESSGYHRSGYEIPADMAASWERSDRNWRRAAERLAPRTA